MRQAIARAQIRTRGGNEAVRNLSGGNQQKVLIEKWLLAKPKILLLNDVTRGVDIGTKRQIYEVIAEIARRRRRDLVSDRRARTGRRRASRPGHAATAAISAELDGDDVTVDRIVQAAVIWARPRLEAAAMTASPPRRHSHRRNWSVLSFSFVLFVLLCCSRAASPRSTCARSASTLCRWR